MRAAFFSYTEANRRALHSSRISEVYIASKHRFQCVNDRFPSRVFDVDVDVTCFAAFSLVSRSILK